MKDYVDKSMGIVTRISEALVRIKPTDPLRVAKGEARKKRNCSDSSGNSPVKMLASRCACKKSIRVKSSQTRPEVFTVIGRKTMGSGLSVYILRQCRILSGASISVMSHCDIHHECVSVTNRAQQQTEPIHDPFCSQIVFQVICNRIKKGEVRG